MSGDDGAYGGEAGTGGEDLPGPRPGYYPPPPGTAGTRHAVRPALSQQQLTARISATRKARRQRTVIVVCTLLSVVGAAIALTYENGLLVRGATWPERMQWCVTRLDWLRRLLLREPRGHPSMCAVLVLPPLDPNADVGIIVLDKAVSGRCRAATRCAPSPRFSRPAACP